MKLVEEYGPIYFKVDVQYRGIFSHMNSVLSTNLRDILYCVIIPYSNHMPPVWWSISSSCFIRHLICKM